MIPSPKAVLTFAAVALIAAPAALFSRTLRGPLRQSAEGSSARRPVLFPRGPDAP